MSMFLVRSFDDPKGYIELNRPDGTLPRTSSESYVPWGVSTHGKIVYAKTGEHTGWRGGTGQHRLRPYDTTVSQNRRRQCQSELGVMILNNPSFTAKAVSKVSNAMRLYLQSQDAATAMACIYKQIGHYFYTGGRFGFGRISESKKDDIGVDGVWRGIMQALLLGRLDQKMSIHDAIGRKVLPVLKGGQLVKYTNLATVVRQDWFDDPTRRGRVNAPVRAPVTTKGGISKLDTPAGGTVAQGRNRGVDMFSRDLHRTRDKDADAYYDDADARNLLFGAGISGTTGTLLQAGIAFGKLTAAEDLKQYTLAIIGYLVGGGMHSYHETMAVASKVGVPYNPGAFETSMPESFRRSGLYTAWRANFYDIVVLGATHWRNNSGYLPSHLNKELTSPA
ncbi:MAG: hypothetical protein KJO35_09400 [Gammaproteobacteria bacterium]|nr:hypothetical protein [Gammaproteobacteria bacterium]NND61373.1 hypothetical protein [Gammaproteobacteria bacterium]